MGTFDRSIFTTCVLARIGGWLPRGWVWRRSALGPLQTLLTVMHMVAFGNKGYRAALRDVFAAMHRSFGWDGDTPTPSALTQARGKLTEKMCRDLFRRASGEAGRVVSRARLRYRDFKRIVAVDGTRVALASTAALKRDFGCPSGDHLAPQALLTVLWDVGGNVPVDWRLGAHDGSEQADVADMLESLGAGDLLLADRLYPSRDLMVELQRRGVHFVMRVKTTRQRCRPAAARSPGMPRQSGAWVPRWQRAYRPGHLLTEPLHHSHAINDLDQRRWRIEAAYREAKDGTAMMPCRANPSSWSARRSAP